MSQLDPSSMSRRQQFVETWKMTREADPRATMFVLGAAVIGAVVGAGLFWLLPMSGVLHIIFVVVGALLLGALLAAVVFSRRAQKAAFAKIENQRGGAAAALGMLRRGWKVEPAVAFTKQQDMVHRVVGPPGIVLIGEGNYNRVKGLLLTEKRKHERVVDGVPVHEIIAGRGEGEVPVPKLVSTVTKLGRTVKPAEITDILNRLKALDATGAKLPLPKGPVPTSMKGQRGNLRGR